MSGILALGAEKQAATSLAMAYADRPVLFITDELIVDGWDLPNVHIALARPGETLPSGARQMLVVPLCPRWLGAGNAASLTRSLAHLHAVMPRFVLPAFPTPDDTGLWIAKGDRWHRPDSPAVGSARQLGGLADAHGHGLVFQRYAQASATFMAIGRRLGRDAVRLGVVQVCAERFLRDAFLQAGESVSDREILGASLAVLDALDFAGFFTLNWIRTDDGPRLTSFRPVPRAAFQCLRRAGLDLLEEGKGVLVAAAGIRFVANPHYSSYRPLAR